VSAGDHDFLNVGRALINPQRPDLAVEALDDVALAHPVAAMQLHGLVDHILRVVSGIELGHRRLAADPRRALILEPGRAVDQQRRGIDIKRHVGDMPLHHLQIAHRRAEQFALRRG
jgi:hypothetical protein